MVCCVKHCSSYLFFSDAQLKLCALLLDVVVLNLHLMCELEPLLKSFRHRPLRLHLLLCSLQSLPHLRQINAIHQVKFTVKY